ncbi:hypothetical protein V8D89_004196 [Ganoderma adspersum]
MASHDAAQSTSSGDASSASNSTAQDNFFNDANVVFLSREQFMKELVAMFEHAEKEAWEGYLYRPWNYILAIWCLTLVSMHQGVTAGPQYPFLYRIPGSENKVAQYVLPDFVLICTSVYGEEVFMVVEVKALRGVSWNSVEGRERATDIIVQTRKQVHNQAKLAFLRHPHQRRIRVIVVCAVWWYTRIYDRNDFFDPYTSDSASASSTVGVTPTPQGRSSADSLGAKRKSETQDSPPLSIKAYKKIRDDPNWASSQFVPPPSNQPSAQGAGTIVLAGRAGTVGTSKSKSSIPADPSGEIDVYHVLRLGNNDITALNPWFRALLRQCIAEWPVISNVQRSWFGLTSDEELQYIWDEIGRSRNDGFEDGFVLPKEADLPTDEPEEEIEYLYQADSNNPRMIPVKDTDINAVMSSEHDAEPEDPAVLAAMIELLQQRLKDVKLNRTAHSFATPRGGPALHPSRRPRQPGDIQGSTHTSRSMAPPSSPTVYSQRAVPSTLDSFRLGPFGVNTGDPLSSDWELPAGSEDVRDRHHDLQRDLASAHPGTVQEHGGTDLGNTQLESDIRRGRNPEHRARSAPQTRASSIQPREHPSGNLRAAIEAEKAAALSARRPNLTFQTMTVPPNTQSALRGNPYSLKPREVLVGTFPTRFGPQGASQAQQRQAGPSNSVDSKGKRRDVEKET